MIENQDTRPVVTGIGVVTAIGTNYDEFWNALMTGRTGVHPVRSFDTSPFPAHIGCEVSADLVPISADPKVGRAARLGVIAARQAVQAAALDGSELQDVGLIVGTTMGEACWIEAWSPDQFRGEPAQMPAQELLRSGPDQIGTDVARILGLGGPVSAVAAACAAGNYAIGRAADLIRLGRVDKLLAGGTDAFSRVAFMGFAQLGALAAEACRPFSVDHDGIVIGEGAAMLLVESLTSARARGARILAEVSGFGLSCDAYHIVSPLPDGSGARRAIQSALADAGMHPAQIDYICAHGTGTVANDRAEVAAVRGVFGEHIVPMSSIKALTGHAMGAASAIEAVACIAALQHQVIPPTWNWTAPDPECAWDVVPNVPRPAKLQAVLNNAYAFGGNNASVIFSRWNEGEGNIAL